MDKETREMFNMVIAAIDESEERINKRLDEMATKEELRNMYENLHHEINAVKLNTEALDMRMECVEQKVDSLETKVDSLEAKVDSLDKRMGSVEQKVDSMSLVLQTMKTHENRIQDLENEVFKKNKRPRRGSWQP